VEWKQGDVLSSKHRPTTHILLPLIICKVLLVLLVGLGVQRKLPLELVLAPHLQVLAQRQVWNLLQDACADGLTGLLIGSD
jgi:hypothetical protein